MPPFELATIAALSVVGSVWDGVGWVTVRQEKGRTRWVGFWFVFFHCLCVKIDSDGILEMKRGVAEALGCAGEGSSGHRSEGKRMRQNCLTDRLYFNKVSFKFSHSYIRTIYVH